MNSFNEYLSHEVYVNVYVQQHFEFLEPLFEAISVYLGPTWIISYIVPILFSHNAITQTRAILAISILDLVSSVLKWGSGLDRPFWWVRENNGPEIRQHRLTCETTYGFPSSHSIMSTALVYITTLSILPHLQEQFRGRPIIVKNFTYLIMWIIIIMMWLDRLYFGCHFLHQCIIGTTIAFLLIELINEEHLQKKFYNMEKFAMILLILSIAVIAIAIYYKQLSDGTEMRSVKLAFKWCQNPEYLKHENSPVYWIGRSFGSVMGVALSAPLRNRLQYKLNPALSIPITAIIIGLNSTLDLYTPKNYGRIAFVAYGTMRNLMLTYSLLNVVPYFSGVKIKNKS